VRADIGEIIFLVEPAVEGGYTGRALGHSIFTQADTWDELEAAIQDAVRCHFEEGERAGRRGSQRGGQDRDLLLRRIS